MFNKNITVEVMTTVVGMFFLLNYITMLLFGAVYAETGWFAPLGFWDTALFLLLVRTVGVVFGGTVNLDKNSKTCCK